MMKTLANIKLWGYLGRFTLTHIVAYTVVTIPFLMIQNTLPSTQRITLDFFEPYGAISLMTLFIQIIRGTTLALILYPFYDDIVKGNRGWLVLFGALWGLTVLGSVEPMPGSIEGLIYTTTTILEHILVLIAGAVQVLIFAFIFLGWETRQNIGRRFQKTGGMNYE